MRHVVVTGAAGFIGGHLVRRLAADGHRVVAIDRRPARCPAVVLTRDLSAPDDDVVAALRSADVVFHLAGRPGVRSIEDDASRRRVRDNVLAGARVLAATPPATPVVVTSSSSVYGGAGHGQRWARPSAETDALRPRGGYARSKVALERLVRLRVARGGCAAIARPFTVAGEGQRPDMALSIWLRAAADGKPLTVLGSPDRRRDVTDVKDVVEGLVRLAALSRPAVVNLGTGRAFTLTDLVTSVATSLRVPLRLDVVPAASEEPDVTRAATARCRQLLGFVPSTDLLALVRRQAVAAGLVREAELERAS